MKGLNVAAFGNHVNQQGALIARRRAIAIPEDVRVNQMELLSAARVRVVLGSKIDPFGPAEGEVVRVSIDDEDNLVILAQRQPKQLVEWLKTTAAVFSGAVIAVAAFSPVFFR